MRTTVRSAGYAIVAALILSVSIILAIEMAKVTVVDRNAESVQTLMTIVAHLTAAERLDRVHELAREKNTTVPQLALAWVIQQPALDVYPLVGNANAEECRANVDALSIELSEAERGWLNLESDER